MGWEEREGIVGEVGDGWGEEVMTLEDFDYGRYGIELGPANPS